jgi:hypothetical protein
MILVTNDMLSSNKAALSSAIETALRATLDVKGRKLVASGDRKRGRSMLIARSFDYTCHTVVWLERHGGF